MTESSSTTSLTCGACCDHAACGCHSSDRNGDEQVACAEQDDEREEGRYHEAGEEQTWRRGSRVGHDTSLPLSASAVL